MTPDQVRRDLREHRQGCKLCLRFGPCGRSRLLEERLEAALFREEALQRGERKSHLEKLSVDSERVQASDTSPTETGDAAPPRVGRLRS